MKKHLRFALSGGLPYNKDRGGGGGGWVSGSSESMKTIPKLGLGLNCFSPLRSMNSYITHYLMSYCVSSIS